MKEQHDERFEQEQTDEPQVVSEEDWFWSDPEIDPNFVHHTCEPSDEQIGQPNKQGLVAVQRLCWCGNVLSTYIDSVL